MKYYLLRPLIGGLFLLTNYAFASDATGVQRNGMILTFGSAQIPLHLLSSPTDVPGLEEAIQGVQKLPYPYSKRGKKITEALEPTQWTRLYFSIDEKDISSKTLKGLLAKYGTIQNEIQTSGKNQKNKAALYAITSGLETYLLPDFFKIVDQDGKPAPKSQAAVLVHEADIAAGYDYYNDPAEVEKVFEKYLNGVSVMDDLRFVYGYYHPKPCYESQLQSSFCVYREDGIGLGDPTPADPALEDARKAFIAAYYRYDLENNLLGDLVNANGDFNIGTLLSHQVTIGKDYSDYGGVDQTALNDALKNHPKSLFLQYLRLNPNDLFMTINPEKASEKTETTTSYCEPGDALGGDAPLEGDVYPSCPESGAIHGVVNVGTTYTPEILIDENNVLPSTPIWIPVKDASAKDFLKTMVPQTIIESGSAVVKPVEFLLSFSEPFTYPDEPEIMSESRGKTVFDDVDYHVVLLDEAIIESLSK